ncbi:hypothetical protein FBU30_004703 [Linnemannia zychae]|nr:hypothetical protein FBU30_004703 [Linnemannia zychae]
MDRYAPRKAQHIDLHPASTDSHFHVGGDIRAEESYPNHTNTDPLSSTILADHANNERENADSMETDTDEFLVHQKWAEQVLFTLLNLESDVVMALYDREQIILALKTIRPYEVDVEEDFKKKLEDAEASIKIILKEYFLLSSSCRNILDKFDAGQAKKKQAPGSAAATNNSQVAALPDPHISPDNVVIKTSPHWPRYDIISPTAAYDFFDSFARNVIPALSSHILATQGHLYLIELIKDQSTQHLLGEAFRTSVTPGFIITEKFLEKTFFGVCLTMDQREAMATELLKNGPKKNETSEQYSQRILQITRRLRIQNNNEFMLYIIQESIRASEFILATSLHNDLLDPNCATEDLKRPKTIKELCHALRASSGFASRNTSSPLVTKPRKNNKRYCDVCGKYANHDTEGHITCTYCNKSGHLAEICRIRKRDEALNRSPRGRRSDESIRQTSDDESSHKGNRFHPYYGDNYYPK